MNQWLAEIYGTSSAEDLEKTAQANLLAKLAEEENLDLSQFSPEELQALSNEIYGDVPDQEQPISDQEASPEVLQKEAQANFDEADFLGRVMAHSYVQELEHIKVASKMEAAKGMLRNASGKAKNFAGKHKKTMGAAAGGAVVGFGAGRMSKKEKNASVSAFEKLAQEQAMQILNATGFDPSTGADTLNQTPQTPTPAVGQGGVPNQAPQEMGGGEAPEQGEAFQEALANRALEMLAQSGYPTNEILARLQMIQQQDQTEV